MKNKIKNIIKYSREKYIYILLKISTFKIHLNKNAEIQNKKWYVLIALISSTI
jgi:hypothetical protein